MRPPDPCSSTTKSGKPCGFSARRESGLCINHDPAYRQQQAENTRRGLEAANTVRATRARQLHYDEFNLTTREQVQAVLDTVIRLELEGRIPVARSRNLIRACSIAMRNFNGHQSFAHSVPGNHGIYREARFHLDRWVIDLDRVGAFTNTTPEEASR